MGIYNQGDKIGELTLLSFSNNIWSVSCSCGKEWQTRTNRLHGRVSCPSCTPKVKTKKRYILNENIHGHILLSKQPSHKWEIQCKCGSIYFGDPYLIKQYTSCSSCYLPQDVGKRKRLPDSIALYRERLAYYIRGARERNLDWELSENKFIELIELPCHFCGEIGSMTTTKKDRIISINGLDRIDNRLGYNETNVVPCCSFCNHAKKNHSYEYFINKIKHIANYLSSETIERLNRQVEYKQVLGNIEHPVRVKI